MVVFRRVVHRGAVLLVAAVVALVPAFSVASAPSGDCPASTAFAPKTSPEVRPARVAQPIAIDGVLDDEAWTAASRVSGFTEIQPGDQVRPPVCTEVWIAYDDRHLYLAFLAFDDAPESIRASFRNRDEIFQDDWVGLILDPYGDGAQAYEIFANPFGIQGDLLMSGSGNEDVGFDLVYRSVGRLTERGYQVEMAIPFSSLRFPAQPVHTWRLTFLRTRPRESRQQFSWATVDRDEPCFLCQFGTLSPLRDVTPGTRLDVLPAVVGARTTELTDEDDLRSGLADPSTRLEPSATLRYAITPGLFAEATVNPDFSQVESDAAQVDVNSTFALSFPERRPFFQDGSELFDTWIDVVYTRSINAPIAAAKTTGRFGRTSVAFLSAVDEATPVLLPFEEQSETLEGGQSASNVVRVRQTFGQDSFAGVTVTDQRLLDVRGGGSVISADAKIRFLQSYRLETQVAVSDTREPTSAALTDDIDEDLDTFDRGRHTAALDGERFRGTGVFVSLDRTARHWNVDSAYEHSSPTFRTPNGFVTRNDVHRLRLWQGYTFYFDGLLERLEPATFARTEWNFDGVSKGTYGHVQLWSRWTRQTFVYAEVGMGRERFNGVVFERLPNWYLEVNSTFSDPVQAGGFVRGGDAIDRDDVRRGDRFDAGLWMTLKPWSRVVIAPELRYASLRDPATGDAFFRGYIARARTSIQFTREWSLRLVTQYDHFDGALSVEPLLAYRLNPFSVVYVGSAHGYGVVDGGPDTVVTDRQFFFKLQYLFRM